MYFQSSLNNFQVMEAIPVDKEGHSQHHTSAQHWPFLQRFHLEIVRAEVNTVKYV